MRVPNVYLSSWCTVSSLFQFNSSLSSRVPCISLKFLSYFFIAFITLCMLCLLFYRAYRVRLVRVTSPFVNFDIFVKSSARTTGRRAWNSLLLLGCYLWLINLAIIWHLAFYAHCPPKQPPPLSPFLPLSFSVFLDLSSSVACPGFDRRLRLRSIRFDLLLLVARQIFLSAPTHNSPS